MSFGLEKRDDLRAMQRAVRDNVTVSEARRRLDADAALAGSFAAWKTAATPVPARREARPGHLARTMVGMIGLGALLWGVIIAAAIATGGIVTLCVRTSFVIVGVAVIVSIARDVRTAIRWWRR